MIRVQGELSALLAQLSKESADRHEKRAREVIDAAVLELTTIVGAKAACEAVGRSRPALPAHPALRYPWAGAGCGARKRQPRALTEAEQAAVLDVLHSERFVDQAPEAVYATLLDEVRPRSIPTMSGCCAPAGRPTRVGPAPARHPPRACQAELVATQPNRV